MPSVSASRAAAVVEPQACSARATSAGDHGSPSPASSRRSSSPNRTRRTHSGWCARPISAHVAGGPSRTLTSGFWSTSRRTSAYLPSGKRWPSGTGNVKRSWAYARSIARIMPRRRPQAVTQASRRLAALPSSSCSSMPAWYTSQAARWSPSSAKRPAWPMA